MQNVTVSCPTIGTSAYFTFKEPVTRSLQNRLGVTSGQIYLKVSAINELREMLQSELRDPFLEAYAPASIEHAQYKADLLNNIEIITFKYVTPANAVKYVRVPLSFIQGYEAVADIVYVNKTLVLDLGPQHQDMDLALFHSELVSFLQSRTGVTAQLKEVSIGDIQTLSAEEHQTREAIRVGSITVEKTLVTQLAELQLKYQSVIDRLQQLNISLG